MVDCLIGFGSNIGDGAGNLLRALAHLSCHGNVMISSVSRSYRTRPIGGPSTQGEYLNAAIRVETICGPDEILMLLLQVERELGRERGERWGPRTADLDLLLYGDAVVQCPRLTLPHPRMIARRFVLVPAVEIAGDMVHPGCGWTLREILEYLDDAMPYLACMGPPGIGKSWVLDELERRQLGRYLRVSDIPSGLARCASFPDFVEGDRDGYSRYRLELLERNVRPDAEVLSMTDFWWDQSRAYAPPGATRDSDSGELALDRLDQFVPRPQLAVAWIPHSHQTRLARNMRELACEQGRGPVLFLESESRDEALAEISAAIEASRPGCVSVWEETT
jgi:2-amino-4-hydroxy-6-hydroxymethyldihydropteridine diphosphokinase